jgi:FkbM family methyltransferase
MTNNKLYSQNSEESYIVDYFKDKKLGKFMDIGGFNPFMFSNTRKLYEFGWDGIIVEPSPTCFKSFIDEYEGNDRIALLNIAVGDTTDHIKFYESEGDAVSTTDIDHKNKWAKCGVPYREITVPIMETESFFNTYCKGVDFLSIDTESTNMGIFRKIPSWVWESISCICIEHDGAYVEIKGTLVDYGLIEIYRNAENIICAK